MIAVIDEAVAEGAGGRIYVIAAVAFVPDRFAASAELGRVAGGGTRSRPLHWHTEGPQARRGLVAAAERIGAVGGVFASSCGRRQEERARSVNLQLAFGWVLHEGVRELVIESRGTQQDIRDRRTLKEFSLNHEACELSVSWETKAAPVLWLADALASATREELLAPHTKPSSAQLLELMGATQVTWTNLESV